MPKIGLTIDEAEVVEWLVSVGDRVTQGQPLVRLNADKTELDVEAPAEGSVSSIVVDPGGIVAVGGVLATIDAGSTAVERSVEIASEEAVIAAPAGPAPSPAAVPTPSRRRAASPRARALAGQRGLDLSRLHGTGPGGRIVARDVPLAAPAPAHPGGGEGGRPLTATAHVRIGRALEVQRQLRLRAHPVALVDIVLAAVVAAVDHGDLAAPLERPTVSIAVATMSSSRPEFHTVDVGDDIGSPLSAASIVAVAGRRSQSRTRPATKTPVGDIVVLDATETTVAAFEPERWATAATTIALGAIEARPVVVRGQFQVAEELTVVVVADPARSTSFATVDLLARVASAIEHLRVAVGEAHT